MLERSLPLTGETLPTSLTRIVVEASVAGQELGGSFAPATHLARDLVWDGKDGMLLVVIPSGRSGFGHAKER